MGSVKFRWDGDQLELAEGYANISDTWFEVFEYDKGGHPRKVCFGEVGSKKEARRQVEMYILQNKWQP